MATIPPPSAPRNLEQDQRKIRSPLASLRKYIHSYVSLEGLALTGLFVALWFWLGFLLDYGVFKLTLLDWVQAVPWAFRAGVLFLGVAALLAILLLLVVMRLFREFSDSSLALVLERRFPGLLGDRLITAVEMSDPQQAASYGYSPALVKETIHEAADRVDQLPIGQVFDWRRLTRKGVWLVILTLAGYLVVGGSFCLARGIQKEPPAVEGYADFNEVAGIWAERNILLRNTIWPRKAYLEVLPWERTKDAGAKVEGGQAAETETIDPNELRIPQNSVPPMLRVRAWKYVVADGSAAEGWRLLTWADLEARPELAGGEAVVKLPDGWKPRDEAVGLTADEVELLLDAFPLRTQVAGVTLPAKWSVVSPSDEVGYRPLMWADLTKEKLGGMDVPGIPGSWDPKALPAAAMSGLIKSNPLGTAARLVLGPKYISLSVDEVEQKLADARQKNEMDETGKLVEQALERLKRLGDLRAALDRVEATAGQRAMRRTVRKLVVPETVTLTYKGLRTTSTGAMTRVAGNEYTGTFAELKESVTFTVRGEDYVTPTRTITVVERPRVDTLESEEERPAYLYYRPSGDIAAAEIRGKLQPLQPVKLSVTGPATTAEVPAGTHVVLRATISKPLKSFATSVEAKDQKNYKGEKPERVDERTFTIRLPDVRREQRLKLVFEDTDEVVGERQVIISPKDDTNPRVREFNPDEVIRRGRGSEGYIIAVGCRIPFKGRVADDHGLSRVRYGCRVIPADFLSDQKARSILGLGAMPLFRPGHGGPALGAAYLTALGKELAQSTTDEAGPEQLIDLPEFVRAMTSNRPGEGQEEILTRETFLLRMAAKQKEPYRKLLREFQLSPDRWTEQWGENDEDTPNPSRWYKADDRRTPIGCDLPVWKLRYRDTKDDKDKPLKDPDDAKPQKRFILEIRLLAEDTYLDGEQGVPHTSPSGETFTFVVVPENELLSRIAEEEETKYRELQKAFKPLTDNQTRMRDVHFALSAGPAGIDVGLLNSFIARSDSLTEVLRTSHVDVKSVYSTYERIVRELRVNQVREDILARVFKTIYLPLEKVSNTQFDRTINATVALRRALDNPTASVPERVAASTEKAKEAEKELETLITSLNSILAAMEGLSKLNELIAELARIEKEEQDLESLVYRLYTKRLKQELENFDKDDKK